MEKSEMKSNEAEIMRCECTFSFSEWQCAERHKPKMQPTGKNMLMKGWKSRNIDKWKAERVNKRKSERGGERERDEGM